MTKHTMEGVNKTMKDNKETKFNDYLSKAFLAAHHGKLVPVDAILKIQKHIDYIKSQTKKELLRDLTKEVEIKGKNLYWKKVLPEYNFNRLKTKLYSMAISDITNFLQSLSTESDNHTLKP